MSDSKDSKEKITQITSIPKDGQIIMSMLREMGIIDFDPKVINILNEFIYKYATNVLEEARSFGTSYKKDKSLNVDDVRLAIQLHTESSFITPLPREVVLESANVRNYDALPPIKHHCGLRLPPDRYCLSSCNYILKGVRKKQHSITNSSTNNTMKINSKNNSCLIKRSPLSMAKQAISLTKSSPKTSPILNNNENSNNKDLINSNSNNGGVTNGNDRKSPLKPKIQVSTSSLNIHSINSTSSGDSNEMISLKRKREDENDLSN